MMVAEMMMHQMTVVIMETKATAGMMAEEIVEGNIILWPHH
jgi:hypothetical protein